MQRSNFQLDAAQREDARRALRLLAGKGLSLEECVRLALQLPAGADGIQAAPLASAIGQFLEDVRRRGRRPNTIAFYESALATLERARPGLTTAGLDVAVAEAWLGEPQLSAGGRAARWRALRAFARWAEWQDPPLMRARQLERVRVEPGGGKDEPAFLAVEDVRTILSNAPGRIVPALALCLFAGLRPWEACRIEWGSIDVRGRLIRVPGAIAKTGRARIVEGLPQTVWAWLRGREGSGRVCTARPDEFTRAARSAGGFGPGRPWPYDGLRHSFGTYHVAAYRNPAKTALIMGHIGSTALLHKHYRGLARQSEAREYWALRP